MAPALPRILLVGTQLSKALAVFQIFLALSISQSLAETCFSQRIDGLSQIIEYIEKLELRSNDYNIRLLEFESQKSVDGQISQLEYFGW